MELAFITVTLILVFVHFQQPFYVGVNTDNPTMQTTSMLLLVKNTDYITYKLPGEEQVKKFTVVQLQLSEDNYRQILIKDREIIDYMLDNYGDMMTIEQIEALKKYKDMIQRSLAGIDEMSSNDVVKMEYYVYQVYLSIFKEYEEDKKVQLISLVKTYNKLKNYDPMPKLEPVKKELLFDIRKQYYLLKNWTHGMDYYYKKIKPKNIELIQKSERLVEYNYLYNKAVHYYELYKILEDEGLVPDDLKSTWDKEIQPLYTDFLRGVSLDFDVKMMEDYVFTLLELLRSSAINNLEDAYNYAIELEVIPFFEKGRALKQIKSLEEKINSYQFDENTAPETVKEFVNDYKDAIRMKSHIKWMYVRDVVILFLLMLGVLYFVLTKSGF